MRDWIDISEALGWQVDPDLTANDAEMRSEFRGYSREQRHFSQKEMRLVQDENHIRKIKGAFSKVPADINVYIWQSKNPDYDLTAFQGRVSEEWLERRMPGVLGRLTDRNSINVILTNNMSDEHRVSLSSPWIVAHRLSHAIFDGSHQSMKDDDPNDRVSDLIESFLRKIIDVGYEDRPWPKPTDSFGVMQNQEYKEIYGRVLGNTISTMKSARDGKILHFWEWMHELVAQYLITGKVSLKPLPEDFDETHMTRDPKRRAIVLKAWSQFPDRLVKIIERALAASKGDIFVC